MASRPDSRRILPPSPGGRTSLVVDGERPTGSSVRFARPPAGRPHHCLGAAIDFSPGLSARVDIGDRSVRAAGAALFVRRRDDLEIYETVFDRFWRQRGRPLGSEGPTTADPDAVQAEEDEAGGVAAEEGADSRSREEAADGQPVPSDLDSDDPDADEAIDGMVVSEQAYSAGEVDRHRQFDRMTAAELRDAERLIDLLIPNLERRRTRRSELHRHGRIVAPRAMFPRSLATGATSSTGSGGRPAASRGRWSSSATFPASRWNATPGVLLRFSQAFAASTVRTEAFCLGTRPTRVTRSSGTPRSRPGARPGGRHTVTDWPGGTRIGHRSGSSARSGPAGYLRSSSVVVIVSDGWDRGDPALVASETARLQRSCHRLIWLNPLASTPGYQPLAGGMSAAMPFIDDFVPAGTLASLERLGVLLSDAPTRREAERRARGFGGEGARSAGHAPRVESVRPQVHELATVRGADDGSSGAAARPLDGPGRPG